MFANCSYCSKSGTQLDCNYALTGSVCIALMHDQLWNKKKQFQCNLLVYSFTTLTTHAYIINALFMLSQTVGCICMQLCMNDVCRTESCILVTLRHEPSVVVFACVVVAVVVVVCCFATGQL